MNEPKDLNGIEIEEVSLKICALLDHENIMSHSALDVLVNTFSSYLATYSSSRDHLLEGVELCKELCLKKYDCELILREQEVNES